MGMCELEVCAESCKHGARLGALAGITLGCLAAWQVAARLLDAVGPVVRDLAVSVVVAAAGVAGAATVLAVLRLYRRRRVMSAGVLRAAAVPAVAIPAVGVPLALAAGASLFTGPLTVAAAYVMARWVRVVVRASIEARRPGAYEALRALPVRATVRTLPPGAPSARPVLEGRVVPAAKGISQ
jgi:hypothetical protein